MTKRIIDYLKGSTVVKESGSIEEEPGHLCRRNRRVINQFDMGLILINVRVRGYPLRCADVVVEDRMDVLSRDREPEVLLIF